MNQMNFKKSASETKNYCPISSAAEVFSDYWSIIILRDIGVCNKRTYNSILANNNENISTATLANRLKRMCDIGLLSFKSDPTHSQRKIYCLSSKAIELMPILVDMSLWALKHNPPSTEPVSDLQKMENLMSSYSKKLVEQLKSSHLN